MRPNKIGRTQRCARVQNLASEWPRNVTYPIQKITNKVANTPMDPITPIGIYNSPSIEAEQNGLARAGLSACDYADIKGAPTYARLRILLSDSSKQEDKRWTCVMLGCIAPGVHQRTPAQGNESPVESLQVISENN